MEVDYVPSTVPDSDPRAALLVLEDNEAVIKMTIKGRAPKLPHVARTHRMSLVFDSGVHIGSCTLAWRSRIICF